MTQGWLYTGFVVDGHIWTSVRIKNDMCYMLSWDDRLLSIQMTTMIEYFHNAPVERTHASLILDTALYAL